MAGLDHPCQLGYLPVLRRTIIHGQKMKIVLTWFNKQVDGHLTNENFVYHYNLRLKNFVFD